MNIMKIILSNDDGIDSPGLLALARLLIPDETAPRRFGHMIGCSGPLISEEGETP